RNVRRSMMVPFGDLALGDSPRQPSARAQTHFLQAGFECGCERRNWALRTFEPPDHRHGLLRARRKRPRRRAAEECDELAPPHSITSSASDSKLSDSFRPSALAVCKLIAISNLVGCNTGISDGFAPLRTLPAYMPIWRYMSGELDP